MKQQTPIKMAIDVWEKRIFQLESSHFQLFSIAN